MKWLNAIILLLSLLFISSIRGQVNCVLNYSFELRNGCSQFGGGCSGSSVSDWYDPTDATPDKMDSLCMGGNYNFGIPQNYAGFQFARTGIGYAGLGFDVTLGGYREYITGTLTDTLNANKQYCVEFFVSLGDSLWYASSALGAYFSDGSICDSFSQTILPYIPQIENPLSNLLTDKIDWVPISGEYQALGGEQFITIGDFYSDALSNFTNAGGGGMIWPKSIAGSYYYIDDVSVRELTIANAGVSASVNNQKIDTICPFNSVQIGKDTTTPGVSFHWLPNYNLSNTNIAQPWASPSVTTTYTLTVTNDSVLAINNRGSVCNCADSITKDSVKIVVNACTGINNIISKSISFNLFPNPNNGNFTLTFNLGNESTGKLMIYNQVGMQIGEYLLSSPIGRMQISNPNLQQGIYIYKVFTGNEVKKVGKIVIIK